MKKKPTLPPEAYDNRPRLSVTFTNESTYVTKFDQTGAPTVTYPVAVGDVANAFKDFGASTGLLAPDTLWWSSENGVTEIAIWLPPVRRTILFDAGRKTHRLTLPPMGFVWVGQGTHYRIFAVQQRPTSTKKTLYHAPLPNVHDDGVVCPGDVKFPKCSADTIQAAADLFWSSHFNSDLSANKLRDGGDNLFKDLQALSGKRQFPFDRLIAAETVGNLIAGHEPPIFPDNGDELDLEEDINPFAFANRNEEDDDA